MARMVSYTKHENEMVPEYRQRLNTAESLEDVQAAFARMLRDLLGRILDAPVQLEEGDVRLDPAAEDGFVLGPGIASKEEFAGLWKDSDLSAILRRLAAMAVSRYKYLGGKPERTDYKDYTAHRPAKR